MDRPGRRRRQSNSAVVGDGEREGAREVGDVGGPLGAVAIFGDPVGVVAGPIVVVVGVAGGCGALVVGGVSMG
jgi:hypothetical protein